LRLNHLFVLPMVAQSNEQIAWCRERCEQGLRLMDEEVRLLGPQDAAAAEKREVAAICCHPFYLLYHDRDDRDLMERYGRVIVHAMNARAAETEALPDEWPWSETLEAERQGGRLRIGFVSAFFYDHSNARAFEGLIRYLDRASFEAVLIHLASTPRDAVSRRLETWCERVVTLPASMAEAQLVLSKLALDLLFFTDVGMHPSITKLASCRSAPVQATGWGVPQTSGMPDIDYYVSGDLVEPLQAESHYTETLVRLPGLPCCYLSESLELHERSRDYFVLPPDVPLWGCPQRLDKFHPDFDRALEAIARQVPESLFVFVEESVPSLTSFFLDRLAVSAPAARERVLMLGRMVRQDYLALAGCMDVLLDPFHFGSGITLYETIHTGTPVVTLEGRFLRSRFVAAAYRLVEVEDPPVAATPEAYVELAVALMKDPQRRKLLRQEIAAKAKARLYDRLDYVRGFEAFAIEAVAKARRSESQAG
jgi:protein O-GlcNAc transferase